MSTTTDPTIAVSPIGAPADLLDWNTSPVAGHIESSGISAYDNSPSADADVSGTVMVRGTAHDNVRIDAITLSIDGGAPFQVAHWGGTGLVADVRGVPRVQREPDRRRSRRRRGTTSGTRPASRPSRRTNVVLSFVATDHSANASTGLAGHPAVRRGALHHRAHHGDHRPHLERLRPLGARAATPCARARRSRSGLQPEPDGHRHRRGGERRAHRERRPPKRRHQVGRSGQPGPRLRRGGQPVHEHDRDHLDCRRPTPRSVRATSWCG